MIALVVTFLYFVIFEANAGHSEECSISLDDGQPYLLHVHYERVLTETTLKACRKACMRDVLCASFGFSKRYKKCYIAHADRHTNPENYQLSGNFLYYEKHCSAWSILPVEGRCNFKGFKLMNLEGHDNKVLADTSRYKCQKRCLKDEQCLSFDFSSKTKTCLLSNASKLTDPEAFRKNRTYYYYHKICPGDTEDWLCSVYEFNEECRIRNVIENKLLRNENERDIRNTSLEACTQACMEDELCLSFDYSEIYKRCYIAHADQMTNPGALSDSEYFNYYERWCPGHDFWPLEGGCNFRVYGRQVLRGYNDLIIEDTNYYVCKQTCRADPLCLSFDFYRKRKNCFISHATKDTNPEAYDYDARFDYYQKECPEKWENEWLCKPYFY